ncbi:MAG: hypothetical protein PHX50_17015 [Massilibacteroides sp.]|nr:hypothetical protein [Massilibacteroides sp.]
MKKISLALIILIIVGIYIPAVSAYDYEETKSFSNTFTIPQDSLPYAIKSEMRIYNIHNFRGLHTVYWKPSSFGSTSTLRTNPYYQMPITATIGSTVIGEGTANYNALFNSDGSVIGVQLWLEFDYFEPQSYTGTQTVKINPVSGNLFNDITLGRGLGLPNPTAARPIMFASGTSPSDMLSGYCIYRATHTWKNTLVEGEDTVELIRNIDNASHDSTITIIDKVQTLTDSASVDKTFFVVGPYNWTLTNPFGTVYSGSYGDDAPGEPTTPTVTVYIKNSQTGAAIANSRIVIDAFVDGDYYPVVNRTEPSGVFSVTLYPTGGGRPNPDGYRLIASADGYNNPMPEINFTVDEYTTSIYCYLDPLAGGPLDENNTFIDFFVRDMSSNPITGTTVKFGDYTLLTNSQGYTVFEVGKNATYTYTVSKSGYGSLTGNAVIGDSPRHIINTVLAPTVTPTTPTPIPTSTSIIPTPTMTAPTGEPVSNLLDWFAAHFGMILGGGVEIGKIFMWLCFAVPVGVYVGKEAKAGAAGFMAGAGIVTLFFVLIGWVPIWLLVLLALIIGLLYAKVFNSSDTGGGR